MTQTPAINDAVTNMLRAWEAERLNGPVCPDCIQGNEGRAYHTRKGDHGVYTCPACEAEWTITELAQHLSDLLTRCYGNLVDYDANTALAVENAKLRQTIADMRNVIERAA